MRDMSDGNNERKKQREVYKIYYNIEIRKIEGDENRLEMGAGGNRAKDSLLFDLRYWN